LRRRFNNVNAQEPEIIELTEYQPKFLPREKIPYALGEQLWQTHHQHVIVDFPDPTTNHRWRLTAQGWVGHIPLAPTLHLTLQPKVPLHNLFRMLEYAYRLNFEILAGLVQCQSLPEFYERLAHILAQRVLDRARQGFYRAYLSQRERLPYLRGQLQVRASLQTPGRVQLACHYEEHTADVPDNQILAWTLYSIAQSGLCTERVQPTVRRAFRSLQGLVSLTPHPASACLGRVYHRLNEDYRLLHALCRFFLDQSGPGHERGQAHMLPFLINMESLYELFVAEWLRQHLPPTLRLETQEFAGNEAISAFIDLVLYDFETGQTAYVLDTKYKVPDKPANSDIYQVVAYAEKKGCHEAILIYPTPLAYPLDTMWGNIRVRSLAFNLAGDLEAAGQEFLSELLGSK
jgi:5-methylcytosine-specific restriction enzyme subunit McrC